MATSSNTTTLLSYLTEVENANLSNMEDGSGLEAFTNDYEEFAVMLGSVGLSDIFLRALQKEEAKNDSRAIREAFHKFFVDFRKTLEKDNSPSNITTTPACRMAVAHLPVIHNKGSSPETDEPCCRICYEHYVENDVILRLPCGHCFHATCAVTWLLRRCDCPVCKYELETNDPSYEEGRRERMQSRTTPGGENISTNDNQNRFMQDVCIGLGGMGSLPAF